MGIKTFINKFQNNVRSSGPTADSAAASGSYDATEASTQPPSPRPGRPSAFDHMPPRARGNRSPAASPETHNASPLPAMRGRPVLNSVPMSLQIWVNLAPPSEQTARALAAEFMLAAHNSPGGELNLARLGLTSLPSCLTKLKVSTLNLDGNSLIRLPELPAGLEMLSADENQLTKLPVLPDSLHALSVSHNQIEQLPRLPPQLMLCQANGNRLQSLGELPPNLAKLDVAFNIIGSLPRLPDAMRELNARGNVLEEIPKLPDRAWSPAHAGTFKADLGENWFSDADLQSVHMFIDAIFPPEANMHACLQFDAPPVRIAPQRPIAEQVAASLMAWIRDAPPGEIAGRQEAGDRIFAAHDNNASELKLNKLGLTGLPDCLSKLTVTSLELDGNRLESLPELPATLTSLSVRKNNLSDLPALPPNLTFFVGSHNNLRQLPELPATLKLLKVNNNKLTSLPPLPTNLTGLNVMSNRLTRVPDLPPDAWSPNERVAFQANLRDNHFPASELHDLQRHIDVTFAPDSRCRDRFDFDAPGPAHAAPAPTPPGTSSSAMRHTIRVADIKTAADARNVVADWVGQGIPQAALATLRADIEGFMLRPDMSGEEFDQRHRTGAGPELSNTQVFSQDSSILDPALRKAFGQLRNALPRE